MNNIKKRYHGNNGLSPNNNKNIYQKYNQVQVGRNIPGFPKTPIVARIFPGQT